MGHCPTVARFHNHVDLGYTLENVLAEACLPWGWRERERESE